jgi:hypothetical protein
MRKSGFSLLSLCAVGILIAFQSCKNDSYLLTPPPVPSQSFVEEFDTLQAAYDRGWRWSNRSEPIGPSKWRQSPGPAEGMEPYSSKGTNTGCAFADYLSTVATNNGIISNWLFSPSVIMQNGDKIVFYTKTQMAAATNTAPATDYGARMEVRINPVGDDMIMGMGEDRGNYSLKLLDINREEIANVNGNTPTAYPSTWTRFEATVTGLQKPTRSRFAFRYYLHGAGTNGKGNGVGLDSVAYISIN